MAKAKDKRTLGVLELRIAIKANDGSGVTETTTTPSMWARADEWLDTLIFGEAHTQAWVSQKLTQALYLQAAQSEGLMRPGELSLERIAEFVNLYDVEILDDEGEGEADPNAQAPAGGA